MLCVQYTHPPLIANYMQDSSDDCLTHCLSMDQIRRFLLSRCVHYGLCISKTTFHFVVIKLVCATNCNQLEKCHPYPKPINSNNIIQMSRACAMQFREDMKKRQHNKPVVFSNRPQRAMSATTIHTKQLQKLRKIARITNAIKRDALAKATSTREMYAMIRCECVFRAVHTNAQIT